MVEITSEEQNKVKRMKIPEDSLRDLWDNIKRTNIWISGILKEEKKKGYEKISEEKNKVKIMKRTEDSLRDLWNNANAPTLEL